MAAGFSIKTEKIEEFQKTIEAKAAEIIGDELLVRSLTIDCVLPFSMINQKLYTAIQTLSPFGMGNYEPVFLSKKVEIRDVRILGREGKHLRLVFQDDEMNKPIEAVAFGMGERLSEIQKNTRIDIVYSVDENTWNGNTKLQLKLKDFNV